MNSLIRFLAMGALGLAQPAPGQAQAYPSKPVRMLVGFARCGGTPEEFDAYLKAQLAKFGKLIKDANIKVD